MTKDEYVTKYGEAAYERLPDDVKNAMEAPAPDQPPKKPAVTITREEYIARFGEEKFNALPEKSRRLLEQNSQKKSSSHAQNHNVPETSPKTPENNTPPVKPKPKPIANPMSKNTVSGVSFSAGEKLLKNYHATHMTFPSCEGYIMVTNKRIIFRGEGGVIINNFVMDEVNIDSVSGFSSFCGSRYIWWRIIAGILMVIYGLFNIYGTSYNPFFGYSSSSFSFTALAAIIIGGALCYFGHRYIFSLIVFSSQANGGPINIGEGMSGSGGFIDILFGKTAIYSVIGRPTDETSKMVNEIGAIVRDIQTLDEDTVFKKWS